MISRYAGLLALLLVAASASAQGALTATPNPFSNAEGATLEISNRTSSSVTLDSLAMASTEPGSGQIRSIGIPYDGTVSGQSVFSQVTCFSDVQGGCVDSQLFGSSVLPGEVISIRGIENYCPACRPGGGGGDVDTLRIYSGGLLDPLNVPILNTRFVASEAPPEGRTLRLDATPNPASGASTLSLVRASAGEARIVAYDLLGREVAILHDGPAPEALSLRADTSAWPPGAYVVRAWAGGETATMRLVVVR